MNGQICSYSRRWALIAAVAVLAAGCAGTGNAGAETMTDGLLSGIPWSHAHPILVNFTAGLVPASFVSDVLGKAVKGDSFTSAGWWTILYAALLSPATALTGWYWKASLPLEVLPADLIYTHMYLGVVVAVVLAGLALWRGIIFSRDKRPGIGYLVAAGTAVGLLVYQGNLGGKMVFG
ncbi:MAG TPA: DUF2231 domain-containing protein [Aridibacter sp.]|nr:DUF2231 domain-containing protein [Aridibacter sp.]